MKAAFRSLFADAGRIGRKAYWLGVCLVFCAAAAFLAIAVRGEIDDTIANIVFFAIQLALAWLAGRRFQDLGLSAWWGRIPVIAGAICAISAVAVDDWHEIDDRQRTIKGALLFFYFVAPLVLVLLAGLLRGSAGHNRYGPPPNEAKALDAASKLFE